MMKKCYYSIIAAMLILMNIFANVPAIEPGNKPIDLTLKAKAGQWMQKPLGFQENKGQMIDADGNPVPYVLFKTEVPNLNIWVTTSGLTYQFFKIEDEHEEKEPSANSQEQISEPKSEKITGEWHRVDMILSGASVKKENIISEGDIKQGDVSFYLSHCPDGIFNVKTYTKITIKEVYEGIDWVLYTYNGTLKYDFIVHPHADPKQVKLIYEGSGKLQVINNQIHFENDLGELTEGNLLCYQGNESNVISANYLIKKNDTPLHIGSGNSSHTESSRPLFNSDSAGVFSFEIEIEIPGYDPNELLTIDPKLVWATFYGGNNVDGPTSAATDAAGNLFVTGYTQSANFPICTTCPGYFQGANAGNVDVFIVKFNNVGVIQWTTYYGGSGSADRGFYITTDSNGNVFVTGHTASANFPVCTTCTGYLQGTIGGMYDAFILKFDNSGNRLWATYYGGAGNEGDGGFNLGFSIATDGNGNVFVTGSTASANFPVCTTCPGYFQGARAGASDAFILKFDNSGNRLWATYYGGKMNVFGGNSIATDIFGNVFVTGQAGPNLPVCTTCPGYFQGAWGGGSDAFILKFDNNGNRLWATYYGGSNNDPGISIATDGSGNVFVTGYTQSPDFPICTTCPGYFQGAIAGSNDAFILKFDNNGNRLWATYYGGSGNEGMLSYDNLAIDKCGNVYMSFNTRSLDLPLQNSCDAQYFDNSNNGNSDIAIMLFNNSGNRLWGTYLGGNGIDFREALAVDNRNNLFVAGEWTYVTNSATYPVTNPGGGAYYDATFNGGSSDDDGYIVKFSPTPIIASANVVTQPTCSSPCSGMATVNIVSPAACTYTYLWSNGQTTQTAIGLCAGVYTVNITNELCKDTTLIVNITGGAGSFTLTPTQTNATCIAFGSATVTPAGGSPPYIYTWSPTGGTNATATGLGAGNYKVTVTDAAGCLNIQTFTITATGAPDAIAKVTTINCNGGTATATVTVTGGTSPYIYLWSNSQTNATATNLSAGNYSITVTDAKNCTSIATAAITSPPPLTTQFAKGIASCTNCGCKQWIMVTATGGTSPYSYSWPDGYDKRYKNQLCPGNYTVNIKDKNGCSVNVNLSAP